MTSADIASHGRLVTIDGNGWLHPSEGQPIDVISDQPVSVMVLWTINEGSTWVGWLSTIGRRFIRFGSADLEDLMFQSWLRALPGWDHARLWRATTSPGYHLVWRRPKAI